MKNLYFTALLDIYIPLNTRFMAWDRGDRDAEPLSDEELLTLQKAQAELDKRVPPRVTPSNI